MWTLDTMSARLLTNLSYNNDNAGTQSLDFEGFALALNEPSREIIFPILQYYF